MSKTVFFLVILTALVTATSNILLRLGVQRGGGFGISGSGLARDLLRLAHQPAFVLGVLLYGTAALIWFRIISTENLAAGYVLLVAITFLAVAAGSVIVLREPVPLQKAIGMGIVFAGILVVMRS